MRNLAMRARAGGLGLIGLLLGILAPSFPPSFAAASGPDAVDSLTAVTPSEPDLQTARRELRAVADSVAREVETLRGWRFRRPVPVEVIDESALRAYLEAELFEEEYPAQEFRGVDAFLKMVGLVPPDADLRELALHLLQGEVEGFYAPRTDTLYMIQRPREWRPDLLFRAMVAHELTHALDDQRVSLDSLITGRERTEDMEFVLGSLIEGSATELMLRYLDKERNRGRMGENDLSRMEGVEAARSLPFLDAPAYFLTLLARYPAGLYFLTRNDPTTVLDRRGEDEAGANLLLALAALPKSSEQILHPEKYWDPARYDVPVTLDETQVDSLLGLGGWTVVHRNTAGEALAAVLAGPPPAACDPAQSGTPSAWTNEAAAGWGGDRFLLLGRSGASPESAPSTGLWFTMWDTAEDRAAFVAAYESAHPNATRRRIDLGNRTTVFVYGLGERETGKLEGAVRRARVRMWREGKAWGPD